jgi:hypothetical protein
MPRTPQTLDGDSSQGCARGRPGEKGLLQAHPGAGPIGNPAFGSRGVEPTVEPPRNGAKNSSSNPHRRLERCRDQAGDRSAVARRPQARAADRLPGVGAPDRRRPKRPRRLSTHVPVRSERHGPYALAAPRRSVPFLFVFSMLRAGAVRDEMIHALGKMRELDVRRHVLPTLLDRVLGHLPFLVGLGEACF